MGAHGDGRSPNSIGLIDKDQRNLLALRQRALIRGKPCACGTIMPILSDGFPEKFRYCEELLAKADNLTLYLPSRYHAKSPHFSCVFLVTARVSRLPTTLSNS